MRLSHWIIPSVTVLVAVIGVAWYATRPSPERVRDQVIDALKAEDWRALYRLSAESAYPTGPNAENEFVKVMSSLAARPRSDGRIASWWEATKTEPQETRRGYVLVMESGNSPLASKRELVIHAIRNGDRWLVQGTHLALGYLYWTRQRDANQAKTLLAAMQSANADRIRDPVEGHCIDKTKIAAIVDGKQDPNRTYWTPCRN